MVNNYLSCSCFGLSHIMKLLEHWLLHTCHAANFSWVKRLVPNLSLLWFFQKLKPKRYPNLQVFSQWDLVSVIMNYNVDSAPFQSDFFVSSDTLSACSYMTDWLNYVTMIKGVETEFLMVSVDSNSRLPI